MSPASIPAGRPARQRGATLVILLITLVVITLLSLSTMRSTVMDERMAGNSRDRDKAFQAAEAAVQTCLDRIDRKDFTGITQLTPAGVAETPVWDVATNWANANSYEVAMTEVAPTDSSRLAANPRCMVENLTANSWRVTGRAVGGSANTVVVLQATYSQE